MGYTQIFENCECCEGPCYFCTDGTPPVVRVTFASCANRSPTAGHCAVRDCSALNASWILPLVQCLDLGTAGCAPGGHLYQVDYRLTMPDWCSESCSGASNQCVEPGGSDLDLFVSFQGCDNSMNVGVLFYGAFCLPTPGSGFNSNRMVITNSDAQGFLHYSDKPAACHGWSFSVAILSSILLGPLCIQPCASCTCTIDFP